MSVLRGKHVVLGITGSIAAYKAAVLTRLLVKAGAEVQIVITPAGKEFITPITLSALSSRPVISEVHRNTCTKELLHEHRDIEAVGIKAHDITAPYPFVETAGDLSEGRAVSDIGIGDTVHLCRLWGDGHTGIDTSGLGLLLSIGVYLEDGDLHDTITRDLYPRRL